MSSVTLSTEFFGILCAVTGFAVGIGGFAIWLMVWNAFKNAKSKR